MLGVILSVLMRDIWINVLLQTSALVGPLHIVYPYMLQFEKSSAFFSSTDGATYKHAAVIATVFVPNNKSETINNMR
jgi:hypothetical protein